MFCEVRTSLMFNFSRPSTPVQPEMGLFLEIDVNMQNGSTDRHAVCDVKKNGVNDFFTARAMLARY